MTNPYEVGDKVRRLNTRRGTLGEGDIGTVWAIVSPKSVRLVEDKDTVFSSHAHNIENLELVSRPGKHTQPTTTAGRKDDGGKLDMTLLDDMPRALEAVVEVMQWAITKKEPKPYERGSWLGVHADRYRAAFRRHDSSACRQASEDAGDARFAADKETHLLHLAHQACSALMALENTLRELEAKKK